MKEFLKDTLRPGYALVKDRLANPFLMESVNNTYLKLRKFRKSPNTTGYALLLAAPGGGNIGDQAMVESFIENVDGQIVIIVGAKKDLDHSMELDDNVTVVELPDLVYGALPKHFFDFKEFVHLLSNANSFSIVGADIMDGAYNWKASANRSNLAYFASCCGIPSRILGFSWNGSANKKSLHCIMKASKAGVNLYLRDPISAERARSDGLSNVHMVTDLVFSAKTLDAATAQQVLNDAASKDVVQSYALVNISALIGTSPDKIDEYCKVIKFLNAKGLDVFLLPHVSRPGGDDVESCRKVFQAIESNQVFLIDKFLSPAVIRGLTKSAEIVVTGRMHLSIMSLMNTVPAVTLATQGKVEGLMKFIGFDDWCVEPIGSYGDSIIENIQNILESSDDVYQKLSSHLPEVRKRSAQNFVGLA